MHALLYMQWKYFPKALLITRNIEITDLNGLKKGCHFIRETAQQKSSFFGVHGLFVIPPCVGCVPPATGWSGLVVRRFSAQPGTAIREQQGWRRDAFAPRTILAHSVPTSPCLYFLHCSFDAIIENNMWPLLISHVWHKPWKTKWNKCKEPSSPLTSGGKKNIGWSQKCCFFSLLYMITYLVVHLRGVEMC